MNLVALTNFHIFITQRIKILSLITYSEKKFTILVTGLKALSTNVATSTTLSRRQPLKTQTTNQKCVVLSSLTSSCKTGTTLTTPDAPIPRRHLTRVKVQRRTSSVRTLKTSGRASSGIDRIACGGKAQRNIICLIRHQVTYLLCHVSIWQQHFCCF